MRLAMIVRDEEAHIATAIRSVLPLIDDYCIIDTGSVDRTKEVAMEALGDLPGRWSNCQWVDYSTNRNQLLHEAAYDGYLLLMDGDDELVGGKTLPPLTADAYTLHYSGSLDYTQTRIVRADKPWRYIGAAHEYLTCQEDFSQLDLRQPYLLHHGDADCTPKLHGYIEALSREYENDPTNSRALFYLAETYRYLGDHSKAIEYYRKRVELAGYDEEVFYSHYQLGCLLERYVSFTEGAEELLKACRLRPQRAEPFRALAYCANAIANELPYPSNDFLFVGVDAYKPVEMKPVSDPAA